ncbi:GntR family transcriptional regulator [Peribacillus muralis]|uniref:GntR family transcriptional regulator n=1 Tax=Peribacillus muralis TaxID=264697 RepID=UPI001F4D7EDB|nr:GntR family transcriptional regulator [Peribacillus muralis]MCK1993226.1 GntR family transcriptional regulator [Peribacillus muralis]MCK2013780.1 GntR family transcriptional regulator [Peribacillus muralis]
MEKLKSAGSLSDQAYDILKKSIINNELKPMELLVEEQIASQLGISRTPVRTSIRRLAYEGLVEIETSKTTRVSKVSFKEAQDFQIIRETLEPLAAKLAFKRVDPKSLEQLKLLLQRQQECIENQDYSKFINLDTEFHCLIAKLSNNTKLHEFISSLRDHLQRYLIQTKHESALDAIIEHQQIVASFENGNAKEAAEMMENHVKKVSTRFTEHEK